MEPWCLLAGFLKEQGARSVYAMATHGILSGNALNHINNSSLDQVVITNTGIKYNILCNSFYPFQQARYFVCGFIELYHNFMNVSFEI